MEGGIVDTDITADASEMASSFFAFNVLKAAVSSLGCSSRFLTLLRASTLQLANFHTGRLKRADILVNLQN